MSYSKYTLDSFFAGVGGIDLGFTQTGKVKTIWANEIDKWAQRTYHLNFPNVKLDSRDINKVPTSDVPSADIMVGGFPCQSFSIAGFQKGFKDPRGILFFQMLRMIRAKHPKVVLLENVKNLVGFHNGREFKIIRDSLIEAGYLLKWKVMDTSRYSDLPQHRERIYVVGFRNKGAFKHFHFPKPVSRTKSIHDVIDFKNPVNDKYYYRQGDYIYPRLYRAIHSSDHIYEYRRGSVREIKSHISPAITSICGEGGDNTPIIYTYSHKIRSLTPRETFNLQGFPKSYKLNESKMHLFKQAGNAVSVPVIKRIAINIIKSLNSSNKHHYAKYPSHKKYGLIYMNMRSRYEGLSYATHYANRPNSLIKHVLSKWLLTDDTYTNKIKHYKTFQGYMIEPVINTSNI